MRSIFVYGSLKPGKYAHNIIQSRTTNGRKADICGDLYDAGEFPVLDLDGKGRVKGYIYDVPEHSWNDLVAILDIYESCPSLFNRTLRIARIRPNLFKAALVYYGKDSKLFEDSIIIPSGWWV